MRIKKRVSDRITQQLRRYQPILADAKSRDVSESDTGVIVLDMLADVFGYNKFSEITSQFAIRGTFVDLAVRVDDDVRFLIEVKPIGTPLREIHVKQAIDYGANNGIEWVILTNGGQWQVFKIHFGQPIDKSLVFEIDVLDGNLKNPQLISCFGSLSKEGFTPSSMSVFYQQQQAMSRYALAATLTSSPVLKALRRELRKVSPGLKVDEATLAAVLQSKVFKREVVDGDEAKHARKKLKRAAKPKSQPAKRHEQPKSPVAPAPVAANVGPPGSIASPSGPAPASPSAAKGPLPTTSGTLPV